MAFYEMPLVIVFILLYSSHASAQRERNGLAAKALGKSTLTSPIDTLTKDSITVAKIDTLDTDIASDSEIKDKITYKAQDSIVYDIATKKMYLYNGTETQYQKTNLKSDRTEFDWTSNIMTANGAPDSTGEIVGKPVFKDGDKEYQAGKMMYNFKSQRGKVFEVMTQEGDAYLHSEAIKKMDDNSWFGFKSKYTTCNLEHPHFYFRAKRVKVIPGKVMVTGPANLWIADIPSPLYLPFGIFPVKQGRRSGVILPKYGQQSAAFFFKDGGYYLALNDNLSFRFTGDFYTDGSWGLHAGTSYNLKYKFNGELKLDFLRTAPVDPDLPRAKHQNFFQFAWNFTLDPKAAPTHNFSASVNITSSGYNAATQPLGSQVYQNSYSSNINYLKTFPRAPFINLSISASHTQNTSTRTFSITLPALHFGINRVTPFKSKINTGKPKWYESIGISYNLDAKNVLNTYDTLLGTQDLGKRLQYGLKQSIGLDATLKLFKYLNVTPSISYNEYWYFQSINRTWVNRDQIIHNPDGSTITLPGLASYVRIDTSYGFNATRDLTSSLTFNTKLTGMYRFKHGMLKAIRHVFTPSVSGVYVPIISDPYRYARQGLLDGQAARYSKYEIAANNLYGNPNATKVGSINWSLTNIFDIKVFSKKDTINHERKIEQLLNVTLSSGYNFAADSIRLQPFNLTGNLKIWNNIGATFAANFDPYAQSQNGQTINKYYWETNHSLLRFTTGTLALNATFRSKPRPNATPQAVKSAILKRDYVSYNPNDYYDFDIPWDVALYYGFNLQRNVVYGTNRDTLTNSQSLTVSGNFNLTPKWKVSISTGFDFVGKSLTYTKTKVIRDLHCWELSFDWVAWPVASQQYTIELKIKNPTLQDLKLSKRNTYQPIY
jgi:LptD protein